MNKPAPLLTSAFCLLPLLLLAQGPRVQDPTAPLQISAARTEAIVDALERRLDYIPGEVLVKFKPGMGPARQQQALMAVRSRPSIDQLRWVRDTAILTDPSQPDSRILAAQLASQPEVLYAVPNYLTRLYPNERQFTAELASGAAPEFLPSDTDYVARQWNFQDIGLQSAWDIQPGGRSDLIVAVVDTGITTANINLTFPIWTGAAFENLNLPFAVNPDFSASRFVSPRDFVFGTPGGAVLDFDGHGTHVSATIAESTNNNLALAGIAYNVRIMPVKVCLSYWELMIRRAQAGTPGFISLSSGSCSTSDIAAGIYYAADSGAKVINLSLGSSGQQPTVRDAIIYAVSKGAFVSLSNGNDYEDGNPTHYPSSYAATIDGAMAVAATGRTRARAYYSTTGTYTEIAAPGGDTRASGSAGAIWQSTLNPSFADPQVLVPPRFDVYAEVGYQGTSMAAPHVAGLAALIMSQSPGIKPAAVEALIKATAKDLGAAGRDSDFGYGLIQARAALFGFGIAR
jgi:serine protease